MAKPISTQSADFFEEVAGEKKNHKSTLFKSIHFNEEIRSYKHSEKSVFFLMSVF